MTSPTLLERIHGCIAGLALGDALGMPGQPTPETTWQRNGGWIDRLLPAPPDDVSGHAGLPAGSATDDTTAMIALVKLVIEHQSVDRYSAARALDEWIEQMGGLDTPYIGPSTKQAIRALRSGVSPSESGRNGWTNGAAMRVAPLGFLYAPDLDATVRAAVESAYPTHATSTACSAAAAVACAVAACAQPEAALQTVTEAACYGADAGSALGVEAINPSISRRIRFAVSLVSDSRPNTEKLRDVYDLVGMGMAAYETVPAAFAVMHMAQGNPMDAIVLSANLGGDTDTTAAICGAVCGALHGINALDANMVKTIERVNNYDFSALAADYYQTILRMQENL
ncbi:ADP-ribosylglycohydrolase family protein [Aggregatilineales bacterium SYSU G02658]